MTVFFEQVEKRLQNSLFNWELGKFMPEKLSTCLMVQRVQVLLNLQRCLKQLLGFIVSICLFIDMAEVVILFVFLLHCGAGIVQILLWHIQVTS